MFRKINKTMDYIMAEWYYQVRKHFRSIHNNEEDLSEENLKAIGKSIDEVVNKKFFKKDDYYCFTTAIKRDDKDKSKLYIVPTFKIKAGIVTTTYPDVEAYVDLMGLK